MMRHSNDQSRYASPGDDRAYVLHNRIRNPYAADLLSDQFVVDNGAGWDEEAAIVARHRAAARGGLESQRRELFLQQARTNPEALYDRVTQREARVIFNEPVWSSAAFHKRLLASLPPLGGVHIPPWVDPPEPEGIGEMWWGEGDWAPPGLLGMSIVVTNAGLLLLGQLTWDSDDLLQTNLWITSSFFLSPERMPAANRVRSAPGGVLSGSMFGYTFGSWSILVPSGDQWSKCDLRLSQTPWAVHLANPDDRIPAGPVGSSSTRIINVDGDNGHHEAPLPGGLAYPPIEFVLDKTRILRIDLVLELFFQLEGDAVIRFGGVGHATPALHQGSQWTLQPL